MTVNCNFNIVNSFRNCGVTSLKCPLCANCACNRVGVKLLHPFIQQMHSEPGTVWPTHPCGYTDET